MVSSKAPITQIALTVQFGPPVSPLNPLELAAAITQFSNEFPNFQPVNRAGPMPVEPNVQQVEFQVNAAMRTSLSSADGQWSLLFQEDRFTLGWNRTAPLQGDSGYPGYAHVLQKALNGWSQLHPLLSRNQMIEPLVLELVYVDAFRAADLKDGELSSLFTIMNPGFEAKMVQCNLSWMEPIADAGIISTQIAAPAGIDNGSDVIQLQNTARIRASGSWDSLEHDFNRLHDTVLASFKNLVREDYRP